MGVVGIVIDVSCMELFHESRVVLWWIWWIGYNSVDGHDYVDYVLEQNKQQPMTKARCCFVTRFGLAFTTQQNRIGDEFRASRKILVTSRVVVGLRLSQGLYILQGKAFCNTYDAHAHELKASVPPGG